MNLNSEQLFLAEDVLQLRKLINEELVRRCHEGSLKSYATTDDFSEKNKPQQSEITLAEQHNNLLLSLERIVGSNYFFQNQTMPDEKQKGEKINSIQIMYDLLTQLSKEELGTNQSSCNNYCSGLCKTTCTTECGKSCTTGCTATCKGSCSDTCYTTCIGSCHAQCAGGCGAQCTNSDGCFGSCKTRCTAAVT